MIVPGFFALGAVALISAANAASSSNAHNVSIQRPDIQPGPKHLAQAIPSSLPRIKTCYVKPSRVAGEDDAANILTAFQECNNGGTVVLDANYTICSILDLTFLNKIDVAIVGKVSFCGDIDYWVKNSFKYEYQFSSAMWRLGGTDVNIFGNGVGIIDGGGQPWYDAFATNSTLLRPHLLVTDGLHGGSITGLRMINAPKWFNFISNSSNILISNIDILSKSANKNIHANSDGWDTFRSNNIVIQNSHIDNGDDCVSFKPNSTDILVQGLVCIGSHGISVGSLGQYPKEYDIVENIYVYNISMVNASDGARIKVWPGIDTPFQPDLSGGGGAGYVKNVTYDLFENVNNDWAIEINQCYGSDNLTLCNEYPSNMAIMDIYFKDMWGTTSTKFDPRVGTLVCSSTETCSNIQAHNVSVKPPSGKPPQWVCTNVDARSLGGFDCVPIT